MGFAEDFALLCNAELTAAARSKDRSRANDLILEVASFLGHAVAVVGYGNPDVLARLEEVADETWRMEAGWVAEEMVELNPPQPGTAQIIRLAEFKCIEGLHGNPGETA